MDSTKVVSYVLIGDPQGLSVSKLTVYVLLEPGEEPDIPPAPAFKQGYTYTQALRPAALQGPAELLLSGDMQDDGDDLFLLEGDMQDDSDDTLIAGEGA